MSKAKVLGKAKMAIGLTTNHLRLYGMSQGVDSANEVVYTIIEWVWDMAQGKKRPCPVDEQEIKRRVKW